MIAPLLAAIVACLVWASSALAEPLAPYGNEKACDALWTGTRQ
jgi:hypothetical protein